MSLCGRCNDPLPGLEEMDATCCSSCRKRYHFECNTLSEISWKTYGPTRRGQWKCSSCKTKTDMSNNTANISEKDDEDALGKKTPGGSSAREVMVSNSQLEEVLKRFDSFEKNVNLKFKDFEISLNYHGDQVEEAVKTVKALDQKLVLLEKRLEKSENENKELRTRLRNMEIQINEVDQRECNDKIEISGIKDKNVNEVMAVKKILEKAGYADGEIQHRVVKVVRKVENQEKTTITVQFKSHEVRNTVLTKIKKEKVYGKLENNINTDSSYIFINETLSTYYKRLFYEANKVKREKGYTHLWIKDGKILLKKTPEANTLKLSCMDDLGKI